MAHPVRRSAHHIDQIMSQRRQEEDRNNDLLKYSRQNQSQGIFNKSEMLISNRRRANQQAQMAAESMFDSQLHAIDKSKIRQQRWKDQNDEIARVLEEERRDQERKEREVQKICEGSEELRELESLLKVAYMNKERAVQQAEKATIELMEKKREEAMNDQMEYDRQRSLIEMQNEEMIRRNQAIEGKKVIQQQMLDSLKLKEEAMKEAEIDKKKVQSLVEKIQKEDEEEMRKRRDRIEETRNTINHYKVQRENELEEKKRLEKEEEDRILAYANQKAVHEAVIKAQNDEKKAREEEAFRAVESAIKSKQMEEEELQQLRDDLWEEEMWAAKRRKEEEERMKRLRDKDEMMSANARQLHLKAQMTEEQRVREEEYNEYLRQKFRADEDRERSIAEQRLRDKEDYKKRIEQQNQQRKQMYELEISRELQEVEKNKSKEEFEKQVVEEARRRLLLEHAAKLEGYLPKGILSSKEDLKVIGQTSPSQRR